MKPDKKPSPKKPSGRVFDVSRPGKTPASPTSRPVISGHKPEAQEAQTAVSGVGEARPLLTKRKIEIMPINGAEQVETSKPAEEAKSYERPPKKLLITQPTEEEKDALATTALDAVTGPPPVSEETPEKAATAPAIETPTMTKPESPVQPEQPEPQPEAAKPEPTPEPESVPEPEAPGTEPKLAADELPAETSSMPEAEPVLPKEEEPAPEPHIEPLFDDSGKIVVSNHDHHHRHHGLKVFMLMLLILILAAAALNVALDLELLNLEPLPHTNFL